MTARESNALAFFLLCASTLFWGLRLDSLTIHVLAIYFAGIAGFELGRRPR